ncbi:MAG: hypothetical protein QXF82_09565 [Nitrososphaeria archaeon]
MVCLTIRCKGVVGLSRYAIKEMLGFAKNRFIGIKKVTIHVFSCLLANLLEYVM